MEFYTRDDGSQYTTGKKDTVTKCKKNEQRRVLSNTLRNLHANFLAENSNVNIS